MGQYYTVYLKAKVKDEAEFIRLSVKCLRGKFNGSNIREDCFNGHDLTTPLDNIKLVLASHQNGFTETNEDGWPVYRSDFYASYSWESVLDDWFSAVAPALEDGSEIEVYPDVGCWGYEVNDGAAA